MTSTDDEARTLQEVADHYAQLRAMGGVLESRRRARKYNDVHDAKGRFATKMGFLKATYPEVARNYPRSSGTEMGSIESHTGDVAREWETQISTETLNGISERFGSDVDRLMETAIPLHDIGKPDAIEAGNKHKQHEHTIPIMQDVLRKEGFSEKDIALATELLNHDLIGPLFRGRGKDTDVAQKLTEKAQKVGMNVQDFATLQLAFYQADTAAYPYITHYMKQEPSGRWTFEHSPTIAAIVALTKPAKKRAWEEVFKYNKAHDEKGRFAKASSSTPEERPAVGPRIGLIGPDGHDHVARTTGGLGGYGEDHTDMARRLLDDPGTGGVNKALKAGYIRYWVRRGELALNLRAGDEAVSKRALQFIHDNYQHGDRIYMDVEGLSGAGPSGFFFDNLREANAKLHELKTAVVKYNKAHDEKGRFATASGATETARQKRVEAAIPPIEGGFGPARAEWERLVKKSMAATDAYVDAKEHHAKVIARMRQKYGPDEGNWADDPEYQVSLAQRATAQRVDIEAEQAIVRQAPHMQKEVVRNLTTDVAEKMGLDASIIDVVHKDPPEFDVGDKHYTEAGHYDPNTQRVEINAKAADYANAPAVKGLAAHELTHAVYHQLRRARIAEYQQIQSLTVAERKRLFEEPEPNLRGAPKPEAMEELRQRFPATALWGEYRGEGALATAESKALGERMDTEDGHSSYAKSYWTPEYLNSPRPLTHQNAENETLAEVTRWWTYPKSWQSEDTTPDPQSPWVVLAKKMHEWAAEREDRRKHPVLKFAQVLQSIASPPE